MKTARWIVRRFAPPEWRDSVEGDLCEEQSRRRAGSRYAGWFWSVPAAIALVGALHGEGRAGVVKRARGRVMAGLWQDVRHSVRSLIATPGVSVVAVIVLTLGIGATTAIFSVVDAVLLRKLPFENSDRLMAVGEVSTTRPSALPAYVGSVAAVNYREWLERQTVFESMGAATTARGFIVRDRGEPEDLAAIRATASLFDVLRVRPQIGQLFTADHEVEGRDRVLLIGDHVWRRRFNADPAIVGKTMTFDDGLWQIIGVLPQGFTFPVQLAKPNDIVAPYFVPERERIRDRTKTGRNYTLRVVARLKDGVTVEQARAEMARITDALASDHPDWFGDQTWALFPLHEALVARARGWMLFLLGAVGCVLLIACANVANLMLARATGRSRELVVRATLGASRWRLARALLVESVLLSLVGLSGALLLASWGVAALRAAMPSTLPRVAAVALDCRVLAISALAALTTGLVCGLAPAFQSSRPDLHRALRDGGRGATAGRSRQRLRSGLVVAEVALAVMLVVGAGLFVSSFIRFVSVDLGLDPRNVTTASVIPRRETVDTAGFEAAKVRTMVALTSIFERLRNTPDVVAVAAVASGSPLSGSWRTNGITVPGKPEFTDADNPVQIREVTPGYLEVVRGSLKRGRYLAETDTAAAPLVVVLNEEAVARFFDGRDPVGTIVRIDDAERLVVGVVGNVRLRGPEYPASPEAYLPMAQRPGGSATVLVRTAEGAPSVDAVLRAAVLEAVPGVPVFMTTFEESLRAMTLQRRFNMLLVGLFGVLAIAIASVGIYGVMSYTVARQTQEIGVRMALGARPQRVLAAVVGHACVLMLIGMILGMAGAWFAAGLVKSFLFSVTPHDPVVFASAAALLLLTGLLAAFIPAMRAARVDPIVALRSE